MAIANLALRFLLELAGIAALGWVGLQLPLAGIVRWAVVIGLPVALIATWALVVAPNTANGLTQAQKDLIGSALLLAVAVAIALVGQVQVAAGFAILVVANAALLFVIGQDARVALAGAVR